MSGQFIKFNIFDTRNSIKILNLHYFISENGEWKKLFEKQI